MDVPSLCMGLSLGPYKKNFVGWIICKRINKSISKL
jgi:hypothetical protein